MARGLATLELGDSVEVNSPLGPGDAVEADSPLRSEDAIEADTWLEGKGLLRSCRADYGLYCCERSRGRQPTPVRRCHRSRHMA